MIPLVAAQVRTIVEGIRLLEVLVTAPVGLNADIKMLRESLPLAEAAELGQAERRERLTALRSLKANPLTLALETASLINASFGVLDSIEDGGGSPFDASWMARSRRVLDRAKQRVSTELRADTASRIRGLYVIVDPEATGGRPVAEVAEAALKGGTSVLQLRDKHGEQKDVLASARRLKAMCKAHDAILIVNDDAAVTVASAADGIHVGQADLPVDEIRRILGPRQIVGRSNNTVDEALESQGQGVDYVAVGAVFPTTTLGKAVRGVVGPEMVRRVRELVSQPVVAIGGIGRANVAEVVEAGADCICVVSSVTTAPEPEAAARELVEAIDKAKG